MKSGKDKSQSQLLKIADKLEFVHRDLFTVIERSGVYGRNVYSLMHFQDCAAIWKCTCSFSRPYCYTVRSAIICRLSSICDAVHWSAQVGVGGWRLYHRFSRKNGTSCSLLQTADFCCRMHHLAPIAVRCIVQSQGAAKTEPPKFMRVE